MTQNNERELLVKIKYAICMAIYSDDGLDGLEGENLMKEIDKYLSPISQNEHQEAVTNLWEALGKWSAYLASNGEQANLAPPSWLIDAVSSATSPHKQIPDGWKLVPIEPNERMLDIGESNYQYGEPSSYKAGLVYKAMLNAAPTTSLTSETNTEVGE